jgi:hypothetical protein
VRELQMAHVVGRQQRDRLFRRLSHHLYKCSLRPKHTRTQRSLPLRTCAPVATNRPLLLSAS